MFVVFTLPPVGVNTMPRSSFPQGVRDNSDRGVREKKHLGILPHTEVAVRVHGKFRPALIQRVSAKRPAGRAAASLKPASGRRAIAMTETDSKSMGGMMALTRKASMKTPLSIARGCSDIAPADRVWVWAGRRCRGKQAANEISLAINALLLPDIINIPYATIEDARKRNFQARSFPPGSNYKPYEAAFFPRQGPVFESNRRPGGGVRTSPFARFLFYSALMLPVSPAFLPSPSGTARMPTAVSSILPPTVDLIAP